MLLWQVERLRQRTSSCYYSTFYTFPALLLEGIPHLSDSCSVGFSRVTLAHLYELAGRRPLKFYTCVKAAHRLQHSEISQD